MIIMFYLEQFFSNLQGKMDPNIAVSCSLDVQLEDIEIVDTEPGHGVQEAVRTVGTPHCPHLGQNSEQKSNRSNKMRQQKMSETSLDTNTHVWCLFPSIYRDISVFLTFCNVLLSISW